MKTYFLWIVLLASMGACKKEQSESTPATSYETTNNSEIEGNWRLTRFEPGFGPTSVYTDQIIWIVTDNQINVQVLDGTTVSSNMPFNTKGVYNYELINTDTIQLGDQTYRLLFQGDSMMIEKNLAADGIRMTFHPTFN